MSITHITDHLKQGLDRLISQYKGKPRIEGWIKSSIDEIQYVEDVLQDIINSRLVDVATGVRLTILGNLVGQKRLTDDDDGQRKFVMARIAANRSVGQASSVQKVISILDSNPAYHDLYPATIIIELRDSFPSLKIRKEIARMIKYASPAGVAVVVIDVNLNETNDYPAYWRDSTWGSVHDTNNDIGGATWCSQIDYKE